MRTIFGSAMILAALSPTLAGCNEGPSAPAERAAQPAAELQTAALQPPPAASPAAAGATSTGAVSAPSKTEPAVPGRAAASAAPDAPAKPTPAAPKAAPAPKDVYTLAASALGAVKFDHKGHQESAGGKCETCHHASKPEKAATADQQACHDCHTKPPQAGMKTGRQAAFHDPTAKSGTCIACHKAQNAQGKKAPEKCAECHKKANA